MSISDVSKDFFKFVVERWWVFIMIGLMVWVFVFVIQPEPTPDDCCEVVCAKLGFGVECVGSYNDRITCRYPYFQYGMPEIAEVFEFDILNKSICEPDIEVENASNNQGNTTEI